MPARLSDLHPLLTCRQVTVHALLERSDDGARGVLLAAVSLAHLRVDRESALTAALASLDDPVWHGDPPRWRDAAACSVERALTIGDLALALLACSERDAVTPASGKALDEGPWAERRERASAIIALAPTHGDLALEIAAPWSYRWSTWLASHPDSVLTRAHLLAALDDERLWTFCETRVYADARELREECLSRELAALASHCGTSPMPREVPPLALDGDPTPAEIPWEWPSSWVAWELRFDQRIPLARFLAAAFPFTWSGPDADAVAWRRAAVTLCDACRVDPRRVDTHLGEGGNRLLDPRAHTAAMYEEYLRDALRTRRRGRPLSAKQRSMVARLGEDAFEALITFEALRAAATG